MFEREYRDLAFVPRWSIIRQIKGQSVAEHSYYVALYAEQLARWLDWKGDLGVLLIMALRHDLAEVFMGDMPGPNKSHFIDKERYTNYSCTELNKRFNLHTRFIEPDEEKEIIALIKIADGLDECFYLAGEMQMGNQSVKAVYESRVVALENNFCMLLETVFKKERSEIVSKWSGVGVCLYKHINGYSKVIE